MAKAPTAAKRPGRARGEGSAGRRSRGAAALLAFAAGCGTAPPVASPADAVRAYVTAVRAGDADAIHGMLDEATRARVPVEEARTLLADNGATLAAEAQAIEEALPTKLEGRASLALGGGESVDLELEDGRYALDGGVLDLFTLATPEQAVAALRRALARGSLVSLLRVLARDTRTDVATAVARLLEETEDPLALEIHVTGSSATVELPSGRVLHLVLEEGEWHVVDVP